MCNGVQGEGTDYYGPLKGLYMGSEWNTYDQVLEVDNHIQSHLSTSSYDVTYGQLHRGPHKVGGLCDVTTGKVGVSQEIDFPDSGCCCSANVTQHTMVLHVNCANAPWVMATIS